MIIKNEEVDGVKKREYFYSNFIFQCRSVSVIIITKLLLSLLLLLLLLLLLSSSPVPFFYIADKNTFSK